MAGRKPNLKHGHTGDAHKSVSPTYKSWQAMKNRCKNRADYAGRGVQVCPRWLKFNDFLADMGERPSRDYSIDRIDNAGGYWCGRCEWCIANGYPFNCRWATRTEQQRNRRWHGKNQYTEWGSAWPRS